MGTIKKKYLLFDNQSTRDRWIPHRLMQYIEYQKERGRKGEIAESTINNYYKSVKLF